MFAGRRDACPTARVAQPLRFGQIGFAALQFGGPFRHLRLEFVAGSTKLLLALADRFLGAAVSVDRRAVRNAVAAWLAPTESSS